jgi:hypothetical protein
MGYLKFDTEAEALEAERDISKKMGLPKFGKRSDGSDNTRVIIDKFAVPFEDEDGKWCIPDSNGE